jgi:hypothetical protein
MNPINYIKQKLMVKKLTTLVLPTIHTEDIFYEICQGLREVNNPGSHYTKLNLKIVNESVGATISNVKICYNNIHYIEIRRYDIMPTHYSYNDLQDLETFCESISRSNRADKYEGWEVD